MNTKHMRQKRGKIISDAERLIPKDGFWSPELRTKFDNLMAESDALKADIDRQEHFEESDNEMRTTTRPPNDLIGGGSALDMNGQMVRSLRPDESYARHMRNFVPTPRGLEAMTFGHFIRALAIGPKNDAERRVLAEGSIGTGGALVPSFLSPQLIDKLRARTTVLRAGASTITLADGFPYSIARQTGDPTASWHAENASDVSPSDPTFDRVVFSPTVLIGAVKGSRELFEDSANIQQAIENALAKALALELDRVALFGSGTPPEPLGVFGTEGVGDVILGTGTGAALTDYDPFLDALQVLADNNAADPTAAIMSNRTAIALGKLKNQVLDQLARPRELQNVPFLSTSQVPNDLSFGSPPDTNSSTIILGNWPEMMIGIRHDIAVEIVRESLVMPAFQLAVVAHLRADVQLAHAESFCKITGIIPDEEEA